MRVDLYGGWAVPVLVRTPAGWAHAGILMGPPCLDIRDGGLGYTVLLSELRETVAAQTDSLNFNGGEHCGTSPDAPAYNDCSTCIHGDIVRPCIRCTNNVAAPGAGTAT